MWFIHAQLCSLALAWLSGVTKQGPRLNRVIEQAHRRCSVNSVREVSLGIQQKLSSFNPVNAVVQDFFIKKKKKQEIKKQILK